MITNGYIPSAHLFDPTNNWLKLTSPTRLNYSYIRKKLRKYPRDSRYPIVISSKDSRVIFLKYIVLTNSEPIFTLDFKSLRGLTHGIIWANNLPAGSLNGLIETPLLLEGALSTGSAIYYYVSGRIIHVIRDYRQLSPIDLMNQINVGLSFINNIMLEK